MSEFREVRTVGWKEYLDLPELGLVRLKAKVDTGARTSTLHVDSMTVLEVLPDGSELVELALSPDRRRPELQVRTQARVLRRVRKKILLTLTDRSGMLFRMILGRKALEGDFRVDVSGKYLFRKWHRRRRS